MNIFKCYINVTLNVSKLIVNVLKLIVMVRTKTNFKPFFMSDCGGFGSSDNENLVDGSVILGAPSDKVTFAVQNAVNPLNAPTPFVNVPADVEGSET